MRFSSLHRIRGILIIFTAGWLMGGLLLTVRAADGKADPKPNPTIDLGDGKIVLTAPEGWVRKTPKVRFIDHEFAVPAAKGDAEDGRVTVMGAGGTVEANIDRWIAQFSQIDGSETKNQVPEANRKKTVSGLEVRFVDLSGTYKEMSRPFDPNAASVERKDYRMLAAIITSPKLGNYFIKFYGPRQTVTAHADEFRKMIEGLKVE
jgi:hypothetical protein